MKLEQKEIGKGVGQRRTGVIEEDMKAYGVN